ncbi:MAG: EAL domain-containing protein [Nevskia sp.]|nr:EAL domain-containing protein [Nevskia sp.]
MLQSIDHWLAGVGLLPHGYCIAWQPALLWSLVISNVIIGLSYYAIPVALGWFVRREKDLRFNWIFWLFAAFIFACGTTHFIDAVSIWWPIYRLDAAVLDLTAGVSLLTGVLIWPLIPKVSQFLHQRRRALAALDESNQRLFASLRQMQLKQAQIEENERRFRLILENAPIGMAIVGLDGRFLHVNRALCAMLGYEEPELLAKTFQEITHPGDLAQDLAHVQALIEGRGETYRMEKRYFTRSGAILHIQLDVSILRDAAGRPLYFISQIQDVSEAKRITEQLAYQASHDALTGLPNRLAFEQALREVLATPARQAGRDFLLYLDLDHFKLVNDGCGHLAGDRLLREFAALLKSRLRRNDFLARLGGDEFGVLLRDTDTKGVRRLCEDLLQMAADYRLTYRQRTFQIGLSIGAAEIVPSVADHGIVLAQADTACYAAKNRGRGRYCFYHDDDAGIRQALHTMDWAQHVQTALDRDGFVLHLQKIFDEQRGVVGYEALLRLHGERGELVPAANFLPTVERLGWVSRIDRWVVRQTLKVIRRWDDKALHTGSATGTCRDPGRCSISVNLSARSAGDPIFADWLLSELERSMASPQRLRFEITETELLAAGEQELRLISELRQRGYEVWLDDFGVGYNSFELLRRMQVDGIKIDASFTRDLLRDPVDRALVEAIVSLARRLDLELIAEGVEDERTCQELCAMGVTQFQGYYFHSAEEAEAALAA